MTQDNKCNGWTNYETWNYALWIDNEENWQNRINEQAADILANAKATDIFTREEQACLALMESLAIDCEEYLEDFLDEKKAGPFVDILNANVNEINFYEIAKHFIDNVEDK